METARLVVVVETEEILVRDEDIVAETEDRAERLETDEVVVLTRLRCQYFIKEDGRLEQIVARDFQQIRAL